MSPVKLQVFVAKPVANIQFITNIKHLYYENTKQNPVVLSSRGILQKTLDLVNCGGKVD